MKKCNEKTFLIPTVLVSLVLFLAYCGDSTKNEIAKQLLELINKNPSVEMKAKPKDAIVKTAENNRYLVTFKNSSFTTDFLAILKILPQSTFLLKPFPPVENVQAEELVFLFEPENKYLCLLSLKGINFEWDWSKIQKKNVKTGMSGVNTVRVSVENAAFENWKISPQFSSEKKDAKITLDDLLQKHRQDAKVMMKNIGIDIEVVNKKKENISILIELEKLRLLKNDMWSQEVISYIIKKDEAAPDFSEILQKFKSLIGFDIELNKINISAKANKNELISGILENSILSIFFKPDKAGAFFRYGVDLDLKNLELSIPGNKVLDTLSNIKECHMGVSLNNITPELAKAIFKWFRSGIEYKGSTDDPKVKQHMITNLLKMVTIVLKSKPILKFFLSPLKHHFGEMSGEIKIQAQTLWPRPPVEYDVKILKVDDIFKKLADSKLFPDSKLNQIRSNIEKVGVKDESGSLHIKGILRSEEKPIDNN
ncbi:MAG: hypothetical protein KAW12_05855 [Candidatus Aminicenantes bacterium]|nr:hypothetical protein [Candidatus Aminicenantes bacterium]